MSILSKVRVDGVDYDLMGLGGDVLPVGTEIDIASTVTIPAGWEEVDDKYEIYSTDERCIGRWIDGKPLYRKTIDCGTLPNASEKVVDIGVLNIAYIKSMEGTAVSGSTYFPINCTRPGSQSNLEIGAHIYENQIRIETGTDRTSFTAFVTIEYTKISDTANSPITKRIKKVSQTMPPELLEKYSTDEIVVGTWIDGKPLYRKVLSYSISGQSAYPVNITIPTGYTSTEYTIRDMRGILYGSDYAINLNRSARWTNSDTAETMNLIQTIDGVHLVIIKADAEVNYFNGCDGIVIIEYTKTTD